MRLSELIAAGEAAERAGLTYVAISVSMPYRPRVAAPLRFFGLFGETVRLTGAPGGAMTVAQMLVAARREQARREAQGLADPLVECCVEGEKYAPVAALREHEADDTTLTLIGSP